MGYRLSKIYTRTGDDGSTSLGDGTRTGKDDPRVEAYGTVDELNSLIGSVLTQEIPEEVENCLEEIQHDLLDLGGELSLPGKQYINKDYITWLELALDEFNDQLNPLQEFILPGGSFAAAHTHLARAVCRRAERRLVALSRSEAVNPDAIAYLNRLSDLLFVIARVINMAHGNGDTLWQPRQSRNPSD
jgi:cob(I)alamin adenosyltransferase